MANTPPAAAASRGSARTPSVVVGQRRPAAACALVGFGGEDVVEQRALAVGDRRGGWAKPVAAQVAVAKARSRPAMGRILTSPIPGLFPAVR